MCYVEYNWTANAYSFRINDRWCDFQGWCSMGSLKEWRDYLRPLNIRLVKTDSRTYMLEYFGPIPA